MRKHIYLINFDYDTSLRFSESNSMQVRNKLKDTREDKETWNFNKEHQGNFFWKVKLPKEIEANINFSFNPPYQVKQNCSKCQLLM